MRNGGEFENSATKRGPVFQALFEAREGNVAKAEEFDVGAIPKSIQDETHVGKLLVGVLVKQAALDDGTNKSAGGVELCVGILLEEAILLDQVAHHADIDITILGDGRGLELEKHGNKIVDSELAVVDFVEVGVGLIFNLLAKRWGTDWLGGLIGAVKRVFFKALDNWNKMRGGRGNSGGEDIQNNTRMLGKHG